MSSSQSRTASSTTVSWLGTGEHERFFLLQHLGKGSLGEVDLVRDRFDGCSYARKCVALEDEEHLGVLQREFRLRTRLAHPQIPAAYEFRRDPARGVAYLILDYVDGEDVVAAAKALGSESLPLLLLQALNAVRWLHRRGVIHGDLKPDNLFVEGIAAGVEPMVRLLDLGTAVDLASGETEWRGGTPAFLAPYLKETGRPQFQADLYALGRTFECALAEFAANTAPESDAGQKARGLHTISRVCERLTHADPDLAYADAEEALADLRRQVPGLAKRRLLRPKEPAFLGRESELHELERRCAALRAGFLRENFVLVEGEAGVGKTRLLREFGLRAALEGVEVITLRCARHGAPLEPLFELFGRILPEEHPDLDQLARVAGGALEAGRPVLSQRLLRDLARSLKENHYENPLLVLVDDLNLADEPTLQVLRIFHRLGARNGPLFVGTAESGAAGSPIEDLFGAEGLCRLTLGRFSSGEMCTMVASLLPASDVDRAASWVELSGGLPAVAVALTASADHEESPAEYLKEGVLGSVLARRLDTLSDRERQVLAELAILERPAPQRLLEQVSTVEAQSLQPILRVLAANGFIETEIRRKGRSHQLASSVLGSYLVSTQSETERHRLHERAFEAWQAWPFPPERPVDQLVRHALGSGRREEALELGRTAVQHLLGKGALRGAEELCRDLIACLTPDEQADWSHLHCALAESNLRAGRPADAQRVLEESQLTRVAFEDPPCPDRVRILRLFGSCAVAEGKLDLALEVLGVARNFEDDRTPVDERIRLAERLGAVHFSRGDYGEARAIWEEALLIPCGPEADLAQCELRNDLGVLARHEGQLSLAVEHHEAALRIRRALGDLDGESRSLTNLGSVQAQRGMLGRAAEYFEEGLRLKRLVGTVASQAGSLHNLGLVYRLEGQFGRAVGSLQECIQLWQRVGDRLGEIHTRTQFAHVWSEKAEFQRASDQLENSRKLAKELGGGRVALAELHSAEAFMHTHLGNYATALDACTQGLRALGDASDHELQAYLNRQRGAALVVSGDVSLGLEVLESVSEAARRSGDLWEIGWADLERGRALLRLGRTDEALRAIQSAEDQGKKMEAQRLMAEALLARVDAREEAQLVDDNSVLLAEAERLAAALGIPSVQISAWYRLGRQAFRSGFEARAIQWWMRAAELICSVVERLGDPAQQQAYLDQPEQRAILSTLEGVLSERAYSPEEAKMNIPDQQSFADMLKLMDRGRRVLHGDTREHASTRPSLRPEVVRRLVEISSAMNGLHHREEILAYLRDRLEELFGAENSQVILIGRDGSFRFLGEMNEVSRYEVSHTLLSRVLGLRRPVLIPDATHDPDLHDKSSVHRLGLSSVLCAPLIGDDEVIGIIQFNHRSKPGPFTDEDLRVLELFAHQAATALKNILLQERLDESNDRIRASEANLLAGERMRALGEMSAGVAHDFNNLLTVIVGITDLMRENGAIPGDVRKDIETLEVVSQTAATAVRRLQDFRGERVAGPVFQRIDPKLVVRQAVEMARRRQKSGPAPELAVDCGECSMVMGTESELREVLLNLIINSLEALRSGGRIVVRTHESDGWVAIDVEDNGHGVDDELLGRIFEPFYSTKTNGQGMGLSTSRNIIRRLGGSLELVEKEGRGALFRISMPAVEAQIGERVASLTAQAAVGAKILVVDDDPVVREVVVRMLRNAGFDPVGTGDPQTALALFENKSFDLVLTDYAMPEMNGVSIAREIRRVRRECPIVLLTGCAAAAIDPSAEDGLFNLVIHKPVTTEKLAAAVSLGIRG